jgi:hypothetical protein
MKAHLALLVLVAGPAFAETGAADFHRAVYALHERQMAQRDIRTEEETGAYEGAAAARYRYVDTRYYDAASGRLLSRVRRDAADSALVHIVEVNVYEQGRLVRDFGSISMPWAPLHPVRTFINLHHYNGGLHSFRQYDFFGQVGYEFCEGNLAGKPVRIALDGGDINTANTAGPEYQACFGGITQDWVQYAKPH